MSIFEIILTIVIIIGFLLFNNQFATCPITKKRDFKVNMYKHYFEPHSYGPNAMPGHTTWYSKKGYEIRFKCKIIMTKNGWKIKGEK